VTSAKIDIFNEFSVTVMIFKERYGMFRDQKVSVFL